MRPQGVAVLIAILTITLMCLMESTVRHDSSAMAASRDRLTAADATSNLSESTAQLHGPKLRMRPTLGGQRSPSVYRNRSKAERKCDVIPPGLVGVIPIHDSAMSLADLEAIDFGLRPGGRYQPAHCQSRSRVAIVIPFRGRWEHLIRWLLHMHPFLQKQELDYGVYVINQEEGSQFNRGMLMNIGYKEASKVYSYDCFVFHDVDLLPENDNNLYHCPYSPRHLSVAVDKFGYQLPYEGIAGGAVAMTTVHYKCINGFSNLFFGWGGEDDDLSLRIKECRLELVRYKPSIARYKMFKHIGDSGNEDNPHRFALLKSAKDRFLQDGLTTLSYAIKNFQFKKLFTWISVAVNQDEIISKFPVRLKTVSSGAE